MLSIFTQSTTVPLMGQNHSDTPDVKLVTPTILDRKSRYLDYHDSQLKKAVHGDRSTLHCLLTMPPVSIKTAFPKVAKKLRSKTPQGRSGSSHDGQRCATDGTTFTQMVAQPSSKVTFPANRPYRIIQSVNKSTVLTTSTTVITFAGVYFTAGDIDQISSLGAVFDQYRIDRIECWIVPNLGAQTNSDGYPNWVSVIDYDDANALTTYASAGDYTNAVTTTYNQSHYRTFIPHVAVASYSGSFTSYTNVTAPWIDMVSTGVQHYGIKIAGLATTSGGHQIVMNARYHMSFRNVR